MADPNVVNIKTLPRVEEIVDGNLLIVENEQGTNTIDFVNFVVGPNNVSFYTQITNLSAQIVSLSSSTTTLINNLSASTAQQISAFSSRIDSLSTTILGSLSTLFYFASSVNIPNGQINSYQISLIKPSNLTLNANDFSLTLGTSAYPSRLFGSPYFPTVGADGTFYYFLSSVPYPFMFDSDVNNFGNIVNFTIRLNNFPSVSSHGGITVRYRVFKPYVA